MSNTHKHLFFIEEYILDTYLIFRLYKCYGLLFVRVHDGINTSHYNLNRGVKTIITILCNRGCPKQRQK